VHSPTIADALSRWDIKKCLDDSVKKFFMDGPAGIPTQTAFSQSTRLPSLDDDRENGCIHSIENAYSLDGGLPILIGNIAQDGCVLKALVLTIVI
jgi:dihydroxy-acid dehydratase